MPCSEAPLHLYSLRLEFKADPVLLEEDERQVRNEEKIVPLIGPLSTLLLEFHPKTVLQALHTHEPHTHICTFT